LFLRISVLFFKAGPKPVRIPRAENGKLIIEKRECRVLETAFPYGNGKCFVLETARSVSIMFNSPPKEKNRGVDTLFVRIYKRGEFI
jgi:hypothetical protein